MPHEEDDELLEEVVTSDHEQRFRELAREGFEPLIVIMSFMSVGHTHGALSVICRGNNWQKIAFALGTVFHAGEGIPFGGMKAKGYECLRELVTTCVAHLQSNELDLPPHCDRLVHRLFASQNIKPQFAL